MISRFSVALLVVALILGCAGKQNMIVLTSADDGQVGAIQFSNDRGAVILDQPGQATYVGGMDSKPSAPQAVSDEDMNKSFAQALAVKPLAPESFVLYFEFDALRLTPQSDELMADVIAAINARESAEVVVVGHTDRAGEEAYNYTLSLKRAQSVKELLVLRGVDATRIETTSHGEGNPLIPTADNVAEPQNRRVEVVVR